MVGKAEKAFNLHMFCVTFALSLNMRMGRKVSLGRPTKADVATSDYQSFQ